jgi:hypothetical protein
LDVLLGSYFSLILKQFNIDIFALGVCVQNKMRTTEDEKMFAMEESLYRGP